MYRARHTLLGARRGGAARLRVYPVDPYLPEAERGRERRRIENAFRAVAALPGHQNILTVREFFRTDAEDCLVLVTEDVPGHGLRQHMKKSALALTFDQKIAVVRDVLGALDHAHRSQPQVVHRNLTPDAVLVAGTGRALLRGFDYARAGADRASTIAEDIIDELDPSYQAPECYNDPSQASVAADLYAAGLVFYELLAGEPAWTSVDDMMDKDGVFPVKPSELKPDLPAGFDDWLQSLCAFDVEDRPASAAIALTRFSGIVGPDPRAGDPVPERDVLPPVPARPGVDYATLNPGDPLGNRFRVEESLGRGGFAVVYRVFDSYSDTSRVLKLIVKDRRSTFERLKREYSILEHLPPHPNVVRAVWADKLQDDTPYMVFEYVPGTGVNELLDNRSFSPDDVKRLGLETLAGLEHLHAHDVYHRDVKPSNLLWTDQGVRIIDFNVAVNAEDGESRPGGTRRYIPPDLQVGEKMSTAEKTDWDLFGLGVTLYECATGKYPWDGTRPIADVAPRHPGEFNSDLADELAQVVLQAIESRRADRFGSATAFREALAAVKATRAAPPVAPATTFDLEMEDPSLLQPPRPNVNPFVNHLLAMYSQSPRKQRRHAGPGRDRPGDVHPDAARQRASTGALRRRIPPGRRDRQRGRRQDCVHSADRACNRSDAHADGARERLGVLLEGPALRHEPRRQSGRGGEDQRRSATGVLRPLPGGRQQRLAGGRNPDHRHQRRQARRLPHRAPAPVPPVARHHPGGTGRRGARGRRRGGESEPALGRRGFAGNGGSERHLRPSRSSTHPREVLGGVPRLRPPRPLLRPPQRPHAHGSGSRPEGHGTAACNLRDNPPAGPAAHHDAGPAVGARVHAGRRPGLRRDPQRPTRISTAPWTTCRRARAKRRASRSPTAATTIRNCSTADTGSWPGTQPRSRACASTASTWPCFAGGSSSSVATSTGDRCSPTGPTTSSGDW